MKPSSCLIFAVLCAVLASGYAAPAPAPVPGPQPDPATGFDSLPEVAAPAEVEGKSDSRTDGLTPVVIPEHVHLVDKRSPHKKFGYGGGGYGGGGYGGGGGYPSNGCNVCSGGGGGGYPVGGGGYGGGGSYSQSSSNSQSSSGSWGGK